MKALTIKSSIPAIVLFLLITIGSYAQCPNPNLSPQVVTCSGQVNGVKASWYMGGYDGNVTLKWYKNNQLVKETTQHFSVQSMLEVSEADIIGDQTNDQLQLHASWNNGGCNEWSNIYTVSIANNLEAYGVGKKCNSTATFDFIIIPSPSQLTVYKENSSGTRITIAPGADGKYADLYSSNYQYYFQAHVNGCVTDPIPMQVYDVMPPMAQSTPASAVICPGASVLLTASDPSPNPQFPSEFVWSNGNAQTISNTYTATGNVNVFIRRGGCPGPVKTVSVVQQTGGLTASGDGCATVLTASGGTSYEWRASGSSTIVSTASSFQPRKSGTYLLKVTNHCGTTDLSHTITSIPVTSISTSASPLNTCPGKVTLSKNGGAGYYWTKPGGETTSAGSIVANTEGTYTLSGTSTCGIAESFTQAVTFKPINTVLPVTQPVVKIKSNTSTTLTTTAVQGYRYTWYNDSGISLGGDTYTTPNLSYGTNYSVTGYPQDGSQCESAKVHVLVSINKLPVSQAPEHQEVIIPADNAVIHGVGSDPDGDALTYLWTKVSGPSCTLSNENTANLTVRNLQAGTYIFKQRVSDGIDEVFFNSTLFATVTVNNYNNIKTTTVLVAGKTDEAQLASLPIEEKSVSTTYFDGLGRPMQSVLMQASPSKKDIVQPIAYDEYGREPKKYLPYVADATNGYFRNTAIDEQQNFYAARYPNDPAYSQLLFDTSPLHRVIEQGAPGAAWQPKEYPHDPNAHTIKYTYYGSFGSVYKWKFSTELNKPYYDQNDSHFNTPLKTIDVTDENGNHVREFKDLSGRVILKESYHTFSENDFETLQTYYVYDDAGLLRCVIPPQAVAKTIWQNSRLVLETGAFNSLCYRYAYDERNRLIEKKLPGAEPVYLVYDNRDRLVMTQDGNQRTVNKWTYTKFDVLNRAIITGIYTHNTALTQAQMRELISTTNFYESYNGTAETHGYTNNLFPTASTEVLTVNYYDNYNFKSLTTGGLDYVNNDITGQPASAFSKLYDLATGAKVRVLGSNTWLFSVNYYDDRYSVIQNIAQNHKGGHDRITTTYDFTGKVSETKTTHAIPSATAQTIKRRLTYDHAGRLTKTYHTVNTSAEVLLSVNAYNELGQLMAKKLHSVDNGSTFKQQLDYRYNIRGWLEKINDPNTPDQTDFFNMELKYNTPSAKGGYAQYNGNICEMIWKSTDNDKQSYGYYYDRYNRLLSAAYYNQSQPSQNGRFSEGNISYDLNGNVLAIRRYGKKDDTPSPYGLMDQLTYTYSGNQATRIDDAVNKHTEEEGFKESTKEANEYLYDANGNMKLDKNKQITSMTYNHLNLPAEVIKSNTEKIVYTYDASGRKLSQEVVAAQPRRTDYMGEFVYENNALHFIHHEEGRVVMTGSTPEYQYHLKDHLGNVRTTFTTQPETESSVATLELQNIEAEQGKFLRYETIRKVYSALFDRTNGTSLGYSNRLNGSANEKYGLAKSISVMPGDVVNLEVYAKYVDQNNENLDAALQQFLAAIASGTAAPGTVIDGAGYPNSTPSFPFPGLLNTSGSSGNGPKAYLNWLIFDRNYNFVTGGYKRMSNVAKEQGQNVAHEKLSSTLTITQAGYVYVYLSNEETTQTEVFFDDFTVQQVKSPIVNTSDYYAFGAAFNNYSRENTTPQRFLYQSKEWQTDLGLDLYNFEWRQYDPFTVRTTTMDPMAEGFYEFSQYSWALNNPLSYIDPDGMWAFDGTGNLTTSDRDEIAGFLSALNGDGNEKRSTIYMQGLGNVGQKQRERNKDAVAFINKTFEKLGVNLEASDFVYSNKIISKADFYSRDGATKNDSYVLVGTASQLYKADKDARDGGWETPEATLKGYEDPGTTFTGQGADNIHFINTQRMNDRISQNGKSDDFRTPAERLAFITMHETGHTKFKGHSKMKANHVPGTIMQSLPSRESIHDPWMTKRLIHLHGQRLKRK
jgi:RHS repeat-associated protein